MVVEAIPDIEEVLVIALRLPSVDRQAGAEKVAGSKIIVEIPVEEPGARLTGEQGFQVLLPSLHLKSESFSQ